jgi:hypothetical protein
MALRLASDTLQITPSMQQLILWILVSLSVALLLGAGLVRWLVERRPPPDLPTEWTLNARPVFSIEERRVYRQLREALPQHIVLSKLPLVRFCQPTDPDEVRFWYDLLGSTNVTFAICSANGRVLAAIDLQTDRGYSRRSLKIKQSVLAACRVRYLRCAADQLPSVPELQLLVPQSAAASRSAPAMREAGVSPSGISASRRRERTTLWQDSGSLQDSFFGVDGHGEVGTPSGFGNFRTGTTVRELPALPSDIGGVVSDTPISVLRH